MTGVTAMAESKNEPLSPEHLQQLLGVTSWKVHYPKESGDFFRLEVEQFIDGKRVAIFNPSMALRGERTVSIALEDAKDAEKFRILTVMAGGGTFRDQMFNLKKKITEQYQLEPYRVYPTINTTPSLNGDKEVIYQASYYQKSGSGKTGNLINPNSDKLLGKTVISVLYKK